jgi:hypothetical protein
VQNQEDSACDFQALALSTETDPSTETCNFTIQIDTKASAAAALGGRGRSSAAVVASVILAFAAALAAVVAFPPAANVFDCFRWLTDETCQLLIDQ